MTQPDKCPFCGSTSVRPVNRLGVWWVICDVDTGGCDASGGEAATEELAIAAWNRRAPGGVSDVMHLPRALSPAEVQALHDFRVLFVEVRALCRREGAEAMREAARVTVGRHADEMREAAKRAAERDLELANFINGKASALEISAAAIRALPVPEEPTK